MYRVVQLCLILCCQVKLTLTVLTCTGENPISICTYGRRQGVRVYVDFSLVPLQENNVSCSCLISAKSDTEIVAAYKTSSDSDVILVNTSIRLGDQTFQEATKGFIKLSANSSKKLNFDGDIGASSPGVCLRFFSNQTQEDINVVCLTKNDTTVPTSGIDRTTKTTTGTKRRNNTVIGSAVGGSSLVVVIVVVVVVIMCRRRRLSVSQNKEQNINMSVNQTEENPYNVENELYVSADDDILASGNHAYDVTHLQRFDVNHDKAKTTHNVTNNLSDSDSTYDQPDQYNPKNVEKMKRCSYEYSVVFKNKNNTSSADDTDTYDHVNRV